MVRFSCFYTHIGLQKAKKTVQLSVEEMHNTSEDFSQVQVPKGLINATEMNSAEAIVEIQDSVKPFTNSSSVCHRWKSAEIKQNIDLDADTSVHQNQHYLKKSLSVGSRLCLGERVHENLDMDDDTEQGFSSDSHDHGLVREDGSQDPVVSEKAAGSESVQVSFSHDNLESLFSMEELTDSEKDGHNLHLSSERANGYGDRTPNNASLVLKSCSMPNIVASELSSREHSPFNNLTTHPRSSEDVNVFNIRRDGISVCVDACSTGDRTSNNVPLIVKSCSMPNFAASELTSGEHSPPNNLTTCPRSPEHVQVFDIRREDISVHKDDIGVMGEQERYDSTRNYWNNNFGNTDYDGYDSYSYSASAKDWIDPVLDELKSGKLVEEELTGKDLKIKLIENWVNDLQYCSPLEETLEPFDLDNHLKAKSAVSNVLTTAKADVKVSPDMDTVKGYVCSLGASATTAQLANHGLAVMPFLSAFVSLKVLNLSGNAIARISAGTLPRGLHMLNLSKNNISTIEGLRELTRLRVLDLSYNRIFRIGHGLASCSSLKELYLAGNKISDVEGLHRLLKLTVLDLRFNKISTTKCLGQLAANYSSLQAINLEGNPAQKNVGDEHMKKHLQGLLPNLVYFNRQAIKISTLRDAADRSVRLGINAHQFDRGLRSERKATRKTNHQSTTTSRPSSSTHSPKRQSLVSSRHYKSSHRHLPTSTATKAAIMVGSKPLKIEAELSMRRTQSEGTLGPM